MIGLFVGLTSLGLLGYGLFMGVSMVRSLWEAAIGLALLPFAIWIDVKRARARKRYVKEWEEAGCPAEDENGIPYL